MLHCMQRSDILSWDDLAIIRGIRMLYRHRKIDRKLFERYRRRYSPYGSVASIYLWQISAGESPTSPIPPRGHGHPEGSFRAVKERPKRSLRIHVSRRLVCASV